MVDWSRVTDDPDESNTNSESSGEQYQESEPSDEEIMSDIRQVRQANPYSIGSTPKPTNDDWYTWAKDLSKELDSSQSLTRIASILSVSSGSYRGDPSKVDRFLNMVFEGDVGRFHETFSHFLESPGYEHVSMNSPIGRDSDDLFNDISTLATEYGVTEDVMGETHYRLDLNDEGNIELGGSWLEDVYPLSASEIRLRYDAAKFGVEKSRKYTGTPECIYILKELAEDYQDPEGLEERIGL